MQFINSSRSFPETDIPPAAYTNAYNFYQRHFTDNERNRQAFVSPWYSLGPENIGGRTLALAFHPQDTSVIWLGSASGGLWKSLTGGIGFNAWTYMPTGYPVTAVSSIAIDPADPDVMYIGTGETHSYGTSVNGLIERPTRGCVGIGILKSVDGGLSWSPSLDWQYQQQRGIWDIQINPLNTQVLYAATTEGVYKSNDGGMNWFLSLPELMVMDILLDPIDTSFIYAGVGNVNSPDPGIYRSTNSGTSWNRISAGLPPPTNTGRITLAMNAQNNNSLIALVANLYNTVGIYESKNKGASWSSMNGLTEIVSYQGWYAKGLHMKDNDSSRVLFGGVYLFGSNQYGNFPALLPNTYDVHPDIHDIVSNPHDPDKVYILTDGGLYRSNDFGNTFYDCTNGYVTTQAYIGSVSHQNEFIMLAGLQDNNTILYSGSPYWTPVIGGDGSFNAIHPQNDMIMYGSYQYLNILKSTDQGFFFNPVYNHSASSTGTNDVAFIAPFVLSPSDPDILYAGSDSIIRSNDGGMNWFYPQGDQLDNGNLALCIGVSHMDPDTVYVCTAPNDIRAMKVQLSADGGNTFTDISGGLPNRYPRDIAVNPRDSRIVYIAFSGFGTGHLFRSDNAGSSWTDISTSLPDIPFHCITLDPQHPDTLFAGSDLGVFVSVDGGQNWDAMNTGFPDAVLIFDLVFSPADNSLVAFTHGNGMYRNALTGLPVGTADNPENRHKGFKISNTLVDEILYVEEIRNETGNYSICNMEGRRVKEGSFQSRSEQLYLGDIPPGIYFIYSSGKEEERHAHKFIKL